MRICCVKKSMIKDNYQTPLKISVIHNTYIYLFIIERMIENCSNDNRSLMKLKDKSINSKIDKRKYASSS